MAVQLPVLVHHPRHHLGVGVDVGSGDVPRRAENLRDLVHEAARDPLQLSLVEVRRIDVHPALGPAVGDPGDRGLPGHHRGEGTHLVDVDLGVEADPALVRTTRAVVLDAVAVVDARRAVGGLDRDLDGDFAVGLPEDLADVVGVAEAVPRPVEVMAHDVEVRHLRARRPWVTSVSFPAPVRARRIRLRGHWSLLPLPVRCAAILAQLGVAM
ncbi:MAG: hypothetical protein U0R24_00740 [Solirubrobacterales bacterium]